MVHLTAFFLFIERLFVFPDMHLPFRADAKQAGQKAENVEPPVSLIQLIPSSFFRERLHHFFGLLGYGNIIIPFCRAERFPAGVVNFIGLDFGAFGFHGM